VRVNFNEELRDITGKCIEEKKQVYICPGCGAKVDLDGGVITEGTGQNVKLKNICINALMANSPDEKNLSAEKKFYRAQLAEKIYLEGKGAIDIRTEDIVMLKSQISKLYPPLLVYRAFQILDPEVTDDVDERAK